MRSMGYWLAIPRFAFHYVLVELNVSIRASRPKVSIGVQVRRRTTLAIEWPVRQVITPDEASTHRELTG